MDNNTQIEDEKSGYFERVYIKYKCFMCEVLLDYQIMVDFSMTSWVKLKGYVYLMMPR